jgi:hypothetical protein
MKFNEIANTATRALHRAGFEFKKHSPEILVVTGVVGTVVGAVMACKATTKVSTILEKTKEDVETIHACAENPELAEEYTPEDVKKDLTIVYGKTALSLVKLYAPSVIVGAASVTSILVGHNILHKRNLALAAAYTAVDTSFKQYRGRLKDRFDEKLDRELLYDIKAKEIEETIVDENGKETTVTKTVEVADPAAAKSHYTFCFDETATGWQRDAETNKYFLLRQQSWANDKLKSEGVLSLNQVLDMVGIQRCREGQVVGWVYDKNKINQIDFGIFNIHSEPARRFVNGLEKSVWLTFNVEGDILHSFANA